MIFVTADLNALLLTLSDSKPQTLNVKVILSPHFAMHLLGTHGSSRQEELLDSLCLQAAATFAHRDF